MHKRKCQCLCSVNKVLKQTSTIYFSTKTRTMYIIVNQRRREAIICKDTELRCNFTLTRKQFIHTRIELLLVCALLPVRNLCKIIRWSSGVVSDMGTHVSLWYHVIDHHNLHRIVLGLVSHSQNLCHRALIHQALIISNE